MLREWVFMLGKWPFHQSSALCVWFLKRCGRAELCFFAWCRISGKQLGQISTHCFVRHSLRSAFSSLHLNTMKNPLSLQHLLKARAGERKKKRGFSGLDNETHWTMTSLGEAVTHGIGIWYSSLGSTDTPGPNPAQAYFPSLFPISLPSCHVRAMTSFQ